MGEGADDPRLPLGQAQAAGLIRVPTALDGERVDRGVALLTGLSRAQAARAVADGRASLGGKPVTTGSRRLRAGEVLQLDLSSAPGREGPGGRAVGGGEAPESGASERDVPAAAVVFADADLLVVDKPAGLVVHPGAGNTDRTLVHQLVAAFPDIAGAGPQGDRPGIVHRLDKGTSGLLVVARTRAAREGLAAQMAERSVTRRYLAVVHGCLGPDEGVIDAPLGRSPSDRVKVAVVHGGRPARTRYRALSRSTGPLPVTLVACQLETGRTHQVRVHLAAIGHPVLADERYCPKSLLSLAQHALPGLRRPWLHAERLEFTHPVTGRAMCFRSGLPPDLLGSLGALGLRWAPPERPGGPR